MEVRIGISNRHIHLSEKDLKILFGSDFQLEKDRDLYQPGEYASKSKLTIKTTKNQIDKVRILGPVRPYTQVEISKTDAFKLGLNPPVRDSGDLKDSEKITLVGPYNSIDLQEGCIIASRHIHINPNDLKQYGLEGIDTVKVALKGIKGGIIDNVDLKVGPYQMEMHIDTDDANAHLVNPNDIGEIIK